MLQSTDTVAHKAPDSTLSCQPGSPLTRLSCVWFALCSSLLYKHPNLISVFAALCYTSGASICLFVLVFLYHTLARNDHKSLEFAHDMSVNNSSSINWTVLVIDSLAIVSYSIALCETSVYKSLSLAAGYLVCEHWARALSETAKSLCATLLDGLTLACMIVCLVVYNATELQDYASYTRVWLLYKLYMHGVSLMTITNKCTNKQELTVCINTSNNPQNKSLDTDIAANTPPPLLHTPDTNTQVWKIHNCEYDLTDFVERHPGGVEAILLGRGRDCTALFESYHPFTQQHYNVLKKYMVHTEKTSNQTLVQQRDAFYALLCQRVEQTLREAGVDPIKDRAATMSRALYYAFVVLGTAVCMYYHVKVSPRDDCLYRLVAD
jgi:Cytochrome b5-like Heme/Steroid binding domain